MFLETVALDMVVACKFLKGELLQIFNGAV